MLVLTRKPQEQILIGQDIVITVIRLRSGSVGIGIEAPRNVSVLRGELAGTEKREAHRTESTLLGADAATECDGPQILQVVASEAAAELPRPNGWEVSRRPAVPPVSQHSLRRFVRRRTASHVPAESAAPQECFSGAGER